MMKKGGFRTVLGGNIGYALTGEIFKTDIGQQVFVAGQETGNDRLSTPDYIVAEISSFQLESIKEFRPQGAVIVNITPDHLDRYHSLKEYGDAKARIFENQREEDFLVLNRDDPETMKVASEKLAVKNEKPRVFSFSRHREVEGICLRGMWCIAQSRACPLPLLPCHLSRRKR